MKQSFYIICFFLSICSCNNRANDKESVLLGIDSLVIDSIKRDSIFEARGDTIFANVLYGMNKQEATQSIKQFQEKLKHPQPQYDGFVFADIHFMNIGVYDFVPSTYVDRYNDAYLWNGKLSSVTWRSYPQHANSKGRIEYVLNDFIKFFENRFGKPNFMNTESSYWLWSERGKPHFLDREVAIWETSKRKISVGIRGKKTPLLDESNYDLYSPERDYEYVIKVSFFDKKPLAEMETSNKDFIEEQGKKDRERQKQDSLKSINSL